MTRIKGQGLLHEIFLSSCLLQSDFNFAEGIATIRTYTIHLLWEEIKLHYLKIYTPILRGEILRRPTQNLSSIIIEECMLKNSIPLH